MLLYRLRICIICMTLMLSCSLSEAALRCFTTPKSIHIDYTYKMVKPPLPKEFLDEHIKELDEKIRQADKQPDGRGVAYTNRLFRQEWAKRYGRSSSESGKAEFWGTRDGMLWSNGSSAYAYNGRYVTSGRSDDVVPTRRYGVTKAEWLHVMPDAESMDAAVPYLGFRQPGLELFRSVDKSVDKAAIAETPDGYEVTIASGKKDKRQAKLTYVLKIDKQCNVISLVKRFGRDTAVFSYIYKDWRTVNGFRFPKTIECTKYVPYVVGGVAKTAPYEVFVYTAVRQDTSHIDKSVFDVEHPRLGVVVQDWRYSSRDHPNGIQYRYVTPKLPISEASRISAKEGRFPDGTTGNSPNRVAAVLRIVTVCAILLILFRTIIMLRRQRRGDNESQ